MIPAQSSNCLFTRCSGASLTIKRYCSAHINREIANNWKVIREIDIWINYIKGINCYVIENKIVILRNLYLLPLYTLTIRTILYLRSDFSHKIISLMTILLYQFKCLLFSVRLAVNNAGPLPVANRINRSSILVHICDKQNQLSVHCRRFIDREAHYRAYIVKYLNSLVFTAPF